MLDKGLCQEVTMIRNRPLMPLFLPLNYFRHNVAAVGSLFGMYMKYAQFSIQCTLSYLTKEVVLAS